jgi:hypothetical protein
VTHVLHIRLITLVSDSGATDPTNNPGE